MCVYVHMCAGCIDIYIYIHILSMCIYVHDVHLPLSIYMHMCICIYSDHPIRRSTFGVVYGIDVCIYIYTYTHKSNISMDIGPLAAHG